MLKMFNMEHIRCPAGFYEEIIVFWLKKSQINTENDKKPKSSQFLSLLCNLYQIFDRLRGLVILITLNMALIRCPAGTSEERCAFSKKSSQINTENDKKPKLSIFQSFYAF